MRVEVDDVAIVEPVAECRDNVKDGVWVEEHVHVSCCKQHEIRRNGVLRGNGHVRRRFRVAETTAGARPDWRFAVFHDAEQFDGDVVLKVLDFVHEHKFVAALVNVS